MEHRRIVNILKGEEFYRADFTFLAPSHYIVPRYIGLFLYRCLRNGILRPWICRVVINLGKRGREEEEEIKNRNLLLFVSRYLKIMLRYIFIIELHVAREI